MPEQEEMIDFYDYIVQALAIGYSFDENYIQASRNDISIRNYQYTYKTIINGIDVSDNIKYFCAAGPYNIDLKGNEIYLDYNDYNAIFGTNYNLSNVDQFVPHDITFRAGDYEGVVNFETTFRIVKLGKRMGGPMLVSDEMYLKAKKDLTFCYALYIEGEGITDVITKSVDLGYVNISVKLSALQTMSKAVTVFNTFFDLIVMILLTLCVFVLISFGIKNIRSTMYEIGVLKALGCRFVSFIFIFGLHTLVIVCMTSVMSVVGFKWFAGISNTVLVESVKQLAPTQIMLNLNFIKFDWDLILKDVYLVMVISIVSTIIPMMLLKRIKPIAIIKAKE